MLTPEIGAQVKEDAEFFDTIDDIVKSGNIMEKVTKLSLILTVIQRNYPNEIFQKYYQKYSEVIARFYV